MNIHFVNLDLISAKHRSDNDPLTQHETEFEYEKKFMKLLNPIGGFQSLFRKKCNFFFNFEKIIWSCDSAWKWTLCWKYDSYYMSHLRIALAKIIVNIVPYLMWTFVSFWLFRILSETKCLKVCKKWFSVFLVFIKDF